MNSHIEIFEVGGCVRDDLLGLRTKDIDFTVVGPESFAEMVALLEADGFIVVNTKEETQTAVCRVPDSKPELLARTKVADFVWARKESSERIGRIPVSIKPGTLEDDLARRDFTVNALARNPKTGEIIDLHGGRSDLEQGLLRFVGDPFQRIEEDALRIARGFRFMVTKGLEPSIETWEALTSDRAVSLLSEKDAEGKRVISTERLQVEMDRMFLHDTWHSLRLVSNMGESMQHALFPQGFPQGLRLSATMGKKGVDAPVDERRLDLIEDNVKFRTLLREAIQVIESFHDFHPDDGDTDRFRAALEGR